MGEKIGVLLFLVSCLATLWSVVGVIRPRIVLWWAVPEKRTRGRALGFGLLTTLTLFFAAFAVSPGVKWWVWGLVGLGFVVLFLMFSTFCMTKKELESLVKEHEHAKKAGKTATVYSLTSNRKYEIRPFVAQCSCPNWEERRIDDPGRFGYANIWPAITHCTRKNSRMILSGTPLLSPILATREKAFHRKETFLNMEPYGILPTL